MKLPTFIQASKQALISVLNLRFLYKPLSPIQQKQGHKGSFPISVPTWQMGCLTLSGANWKDTILDGLSQVKHQSVFHSSFSITHSGVFTAMQKHLTNLPDVICQRKPPEKITIKVLINFTAWNHFVILLF